MPYRKNPLVKGEIYHIFTKSIAGYTIFNSIDDFERMLGAMAFYTVNNPPSRFSLFLEQGPESKLKQLGLFSDKIVKIIAYCLMPTHIHLIAQQIQDDGISRFINLILKSYSKYFNIKHNRKGPLWEGRFKNVLVDTDEQLMHLTRYIHLNPVSAFLVNAPEDWDFSSYKEFVGMESAQAKICDFSDRVDIQIPHYRKFVEGRIDYQRELERIKHLVIE